MPLYIFFSFFLSLLFTLPQCRTYNPNVLGSDAYRESNRLWTRKLDIYQGRASLNVWSAQCQASAGNNTGQNTDKGHTPSPRIGIKIPDPAGNRTWADHATTTDYIIHECTFTVKCINE